MGSDFDVIIVGGGIFGASSALELNRRGYNVGLLDPGPLPNPLASSTDISKVVRIEYGTDEIYARLAELARAGWLNWNDSFNETLYHEVGVVMLTRSPMAPGEYEYENFQSLLRRGYHPERLDSVSIADRFPAFNSEIYIDGYYHAEAGYVESGRSLRFLYGEAERNGVSIFSGQRVTKIRTSNKLLKGVATTGGRFFSADEVVLAAGAWTPYLLPELQAYMRVVGMPVFHLKVDNPTLYEPPLLPVFSADVTHSGWYGFPIHPNEGVIKIANHGVGVPVNPQTDDRVVSDLETRRLRDFLEESLPSLANAPIVNTRRCLYCDTLDENFWIARHPYVTGLTVAAGGSGHAFKFGPLIGEWVADALQGKPNPVLEKFKWRSLAPDTLGTEASRYREA
jgi:glycine/D-amino acid oxidase-like deaminating enzyme